MKSDSEVWLQEKAEKVLREVGIRKDQIVLDFGCGSGYYAIPAAKMVGDKGKVYALDKNGNRLREVMQRAEPLKLENIQTIETSGEVKIPLEDGSVDVTLLYDVIHSYYFSATQRKELLTEIHRISKPNALVSVYPRHMDLDYVRREIERADFRFLRKLFVTLLHYHTLEQEHVLNFLRK